MQRDSIIITLAGREYRIEEPVRRRARNMLATLDGVMRRLFEAQQEPNDVLRGMILLDAVEAALGWMYVHFEHIRNDKTYLDSTATETDILNAFNAISGFIARPFPFRVTPKTETASPNTISTPKADCMS